MPGRDAPVGLVIYVLLDIIEEASLPTRFRGRRCSTRGLEPRVAHSSLRIVDGNSDKLQGDDELPDPTL